LSDPCGSVNKKRFLKILTGIGIGRISIEKLHVSSKEG